MIYNIPLLVVSLVRTHWLIFYDIYFLLNRVSIRKTPPKSCLFLITLPTAWLILRIVSAIYHWFPLKVPLWPSRLSKKDFLAWTFLVFVGRYGTPIKITALHLSESRSNPYDSFPRITARKAAPFAVLLFKIYCYKSFLKIAESLD